MSLDGVSSPFFCEENEPTTTSKSSTELPVHGAFSEARPWEMMIEPTHWIISSRVKNVKNI